ncbi:hypothetical protein [Nocardia nova]|uniref:hypothetical protein n=1 Tax=Nocardia nova TaxID=37330 RepID=UPI0011B03DF1|nr:hypothetical protein [Nocardia nova]
MAVCVVGQPSSQYRQFSGRAGECDSGFAVVRADVQRVLGPLELSEREVDQFGATGVLVLLFEGIYRGQQAMGVAHPDSGVIAGQEGYCSGSGELSEIAPSHLFIDFPLDCPGLGRARGVTRREDWCRAAENRMPIRSRPRTMQMYPEPLFLSV